MICKLLHTENLNSMNLIISWISSHLLGLLFNEFWSITDIDLLLCLIYLINHNAILNYFCTTTNGIKC